MQPACFFNTKVKINFNKGIVTATPLFIISWMLRQNILSSGLKYEKSLRMREKVLTFELHSANTSCK